MTAAVAVRPTVVEIGIGASGYGADYALERSYITCELGNFLQVCDQFGISDSESRRESAVGSGEHCPIVVITPSGHGQVGDGVNSFLLLELRCSFLLHVIGRVKFGAVGGALRLAPLVVRSGKEIIEASPSFLLCSETLA